MGRRWMIGLLIGSLWGSPSLGATEQGLEEKVDSLEERIVELEKGSGNAKSAGDFQCTWKGGALFTSPDGNFTWKGGGLIQNDWGWLSGDEELDDAVGPLESRTEFRRLFVIMKGTMYEDFNYKLQLNFAGGDVRLFDGYMGMKNIPFLGSVKLGHFKEPISMEWVTGCPYDTFIDRSMAMALMPGRNVGVEVNPRAFEDRLSFQLGVFVDTDGSGEGSTEDGCAVTGRIAALPCWKPEDNRFLHVGAGASYRDLDSVSYSSRPELHLAPGFIQTGTIDTERAVLANGELVAVCGRWSLMAEINGSFVEPEVEDSATFWGYYVAAGFFLSDDHRSYSKSTMAMGRTKPKRNFDLKGGAGAWEAAARWSHLDLEDGPFASGSMSDLTAGLTWFLTPNVKLMLNYIRSDVADLGEADIFAFRGQVEF